VVRAPGDVIANFGEKKTQKNEGREKILSPMSSETEGDHPLFGAILKASTTAKKKMYVLPEP
jgi:hypothetical protein